MIDTNRRFAYIAALATAGAIFLTAPALAAEYKKDLGAFLPRWAQKIGEHRYRSPWDWHQTMKWLGRTYGAQFPRVRIINQPGIKAIFIDNRSNRGWDGINIYETKEGEVRMFVVPAPEKKPDKDPKN